MRVLLETERLILPELTENDVDNLFELNSDPDVVRFTPDKQIDRAVIKGKILPNCFNGRHKLRRSTAESRPYQYTEYDGYGLWAAIEKSTHEFIGWFLFRPAVCAPYFDPAKVNPDDIELGYRLQKAKWGKGYATEGTKALILKGFSELGTQRIIAPTIAANVASIRVLEKSGLKLKEKFVDENLGLEVAIYTLYKT